MREIGIRMMTKKGVLGDGVRECGGLGVLREVRLIFLLTGLSHNDIAYHNMIIL